MSSPVPAPPRNYSRWVVVIGLLSVAAIVIGTAWSLARMRADDIARAESRTRDLGLLLAEQTGRALSEVDLLLQHAQDDVLGFHRSGRALTDEQLHLQFRDYLARSPHVRALIVADPDGNALLHSERHPVPSANYADREWYKVVVAGVAKGAFISTPTVGRISGSDALPVARAVRLADGTLIAIVIASLRPDYLAGLYRALDLGPDGDVRLMRQDGIALAVSGLVAGGLGENHSETEAFRRGIEARDGIVLRHVGGQPPVERISAVRALADYPVAVGVSISERYVLADWVRQATRVASIAAFTALVLGVLTWRLKRALDTDRSLRTELVSAEERWRDAAEGTGLLRAEKRVQEGEARLAAILDSAMDAVIAIDRRQHILLFNTAAERIFDLSALEAIGSPLARLIPERFRSVHATHVATFGQTGVTTRRMGSNLVLAGLRANGEEFPIDASISHVRVGGEDIFTVILRDITDRVTAEAEIQRSHNELRALSKAANEALEAERRRVARELHDELGQLLTAMKLDLGELERHLPGATTEAAASVARIRSLVDQMVASTRRISTDLRPLMLDDLGLGAALDWLVQSFNKRTGVHVTLDVSEDLLEVGEPQASAVFRIVQESLTNVARHSGATTATIRVSERDGRVHIEVRDNGRGFRPEDQSKRGSFGLLGIRERARLLGGDAIIANHPGGGAVVTAHMPLAPAPDSV